MSDPRPTEILPLLPLRLGVPLPGRISTFPVGRERSVALARALEEGDLLVLGAQHDRSVSVPGISDLRPIGVRAQVRKISDRGKRGMLMVVEGLERVRFERVVSTSPYHEAEVRLVSDFGIDDPEVPHLAESLRNLLIELVPKDKALHQSLTSTNDPGRVADLAGAWLEIGDDERAEILHTLDVATRLRLVASLVQKVRAGAELRSKIDGEVRKSIHESQKEAMLRQQLKAIQKELGEGDDDELEQLRNKLEAKVFPPHVQRVVDRELSRLSTLPAQQAEASVIRRYLELIADVPVDRARGHAPQHRRRVGRAGGGPLRPRRGQEAHPRAHGRAQARARRARHHPVPGGPARRGQDVARAVRGRRHGAPPRARGPRRRA
jgi:ATP-dependent Lon protease